MARKKSRTVTVVMLTAVPSNSIVEDVRNAICREVSIGPECNFRWTPSLEPMGLSKSRWQATGGAIVDDLRRKYPLLAVKRLEIAAYHTRQLTAFRAFLSGRIAKPA